MDLIPLIRNKFLSISSNSRHKFLYFTTMGKVNGFHAKWSNGQNQLLFCAKNSLDSGLSTYSLQAGYDHRAILPGQKWQRWGQQVLWLWQQCRLGWKWPTFEAMLKQPPFQNVSGPQSFPFYSHWSCDSQ